MWVEKQSAVHLLHRTIPPPPPSVWQGWCVPLTANIRLQMICLESVCADLPKALKTGKNFFSRKGKVTWLKMASSALISMFICVCPVSGVSYMNLSPGRMKHLPSCSHRENFSSTFGFCVWLHLIRSLKTLKFPWFKHSHKPSTDLIQFLFKTWEYEVHTGSLFWTHNFLPKMGIFKMQEESPVKPAEGWLAAPLLM